MKLSVSLNTRSLNKCGQPHEKRKESRGRKMSKPTNLNFEEASDLNNCVVCGTQMANDAEPTCSLECEEEREAQETTSEHVGSFEKAESGDFIQITVADESRDYRIGDIFEVDMRMSAMGACDDDCLMTVEEHVVFDEQYVIHKRRYPSENDLKNQLLQKVESMSFDELKALANHLRF